MGTFAGSYVLYRIHKSYEESGSESWISKVITEWTPSEKLFEQRNAIHTAAMEKAARDRHLFMGSQQAETAPLRTPEYVTTCLRLNLIQPLTALS